jgi:hypothetical protein
MRTPIRLALLLALATAACSPAYYVADVRLDDSGTLVQHKCALTVNGRATDDCHDEPVLGADGETASVNQPASPEDIAAAKADVHRTEQAAPRRAAPSEQDVARALASASVHQLLGQCRNAYAPGVASIRFALTVEPSGAVAVELRDVANPFADCAARALQSANVHGFDGAPVTFEQQLAV